MAKKLLSLFLLTVILISGCSSPEYSQNYLDNLANCLAEKGVKEYGAFWCPNCAKQEKIFGSSMNILKEKGVYVECDPRCSVPEKELPIACRGIAGQTQLCIDKEVKKYPDWEFPNGERIIGVQKPEVLAEKAECNL